MPIADMAVVRCTQSERQAYEEFKKSYQREWRTMDPVMLTFNRRAQAHPGRENVVLDIRITPYAQQGYQFLRQYLSKRPDDRRLAMTDDDLLSVSGQLSKHGDSYMTHLGLVDQRIPFEIKDGKIQRTGPNSKLSFARSNAFALVQPGGDKGIRLAVAFMGNVKRRQVVVENTRSSSDLFTAIIESIYKGMIDSAFRDHSQSNGRATVLSMDAEIGRDVLNQANTERVLRPAQLFMQLRDVASSKVYEYLRAYTYVSSRQASAGDAAELNRNADRLQADPADIRSILEDSLGATFKYPAGGTYQLTGNGQRHRPQYWTSSAWQKPSLADETAVPDEYRFPFLTWLRGMSLECSLTSTTLRSRLELDVAHKSPDEHELSPFEMASTSR